MMILYNYVNGKNEGELMLLSVVSKTYEDYYIRSEAGFVWIATKEFTLKEYKGKITMEEVRELNPEYWL